MIVEGYDGMRRHGGGAPMVQTKDTDQGYTGRLE